MERGEADITESNAESRLKLVTSERAQTGWDRRRRAADPCGPQAGALTGAPLVPAVAKRLQEGRQEEGHRALLVSHLGGGAGMPGRICPWPWAGGCRGGGFRVRVDDAGLQMHSEEQMGNWRARAV